MATAGQVSRAANNSVQNVYRSLNKDEPQPKKAAVRSQGLTNRAL